MKIYWQDVIVIISFLLYIGAGISTRFVLNEASKTTAYANQLEMDPIARKTLDFVYGLEVIEIIGISLLGSLYYIIRRRYMRHKTEASLIIWELYACMFFFIFLFNFANDFPIALKFYLGG